MENLIDRLGLQSDAFQESFDILSRAKSLDELAQKFFHVLRGNLLVVNAAVLFKPAGNSHWQVLFTKDKRPGMDYADLLQGNGDFRVTAIEHPEYKVAINHALIDKASFGILLGAKLDRSSYGQFDKIVLQFFLQQLDSAYQFFISRAKEKQLVFALNHRVVQLNSLIDTGIEVGRLQDRSQLLHLSLERVLALTNAAKGMLRVKQGRQVIKKIFFPFPFKSKQIENGKYQISTSFRFADKTYNFYLFEKESRAGRVAFDATDQLLLDAFARQVHVSLENHYLHEQALEKERIDQDISVAGTIQKKLIPAALPQIAGYEQYGINIPTKFIGGDFYDCIPLENGHFLFILADVSGKGVPAGLLVSTLHASVHAYIENPFSLAALVQKLNRVIYDASTDDKFITAFFALLDPESGELESVSAGHNPVYILRADKTVDELAAGGIPLGMVGFTLPYASETSRLNRGDRMLLYTDGVTEAMNASEQEYDDVRPLKDFLVASNATSAKDFIHDLIADVHDFTGATPQSDDITALFVVRQD